jgi:hypothetical protein
MSQQQPLVKGRRPIPGLLDGEDQTLAMLSALGSELAVARERIDTLERLLVQRGVLEDNAVEGFEPDGAASAARDALRRRIIAKIFHPLREAARRTAEITTGA